MDKEANPQIRKLLKDLRHSLSKVFSDSPEVNRVLNRIREQGWALYLIIDKTENPAEHNAFELSAEMADDDVEPTFRINGRDLTFLRSVGIDPTRTLRRRRKS